MLITSMCNGDGALAPAAGDVLCHKPSVQMTRAVANTYIQTPNSERSGDRNGVTPNTRVGGGASVRFYTSEASTVYGTTCVRVTL